MWGNLTFLLTTSISNGGGVCVCVPVEEESRGVVLGAERLDVAVAPLEPSPSVVLVAAAAAAAAAE